MELRGLVEKRKKGGEGDTDMEQGGEEKDRKLEQVE